MRKVSTTEHPRTALRPVRLEDRWDAQAGGAFLSGVQAIVRSLLDRRRADQRLGLRTRGFVSGYQGSPLGGLDVELGRLRGTLDELGIVFEPGLNEELAATAVMGSQMAYRLPGATAEGVLGMWFGKNPGLDRAADAIRHANLAGVGPAGGAVAVVGDDPDCKSSTVPSACERTLSGLLVPVLAPASVADVVELGRHAFGLSRAAGVWCALKVVADVADATATVAFDDLPGAIERLVDFAPTTKNLLGGAALEPERHLLEVRLPAAIEYARMHDLNRVAVAGERDTVGAIAAGPSYAELRRALADLGLGEDDLRRLGVRILKVGMPWPLDERAVREFASGLETVLVVEDKLPFLEHEVRSALYGSPNAPVVVGKRDAAGQPLLSTAGAVRADEISRALASLLSERLHELPQTIRRLEELRRPLVLPTLPVARTPFFCSGCPHSTSTRADSSTLVGAGIGCHVMLVQEDDRAGDIVGLTQMGGEGAQWIGMAPFTTREHFTQNLGDGTFHHSGSLAVRAAIAAGVNVTYKLLYNDAVAMTGGQRVQGVMPVPELTRALAAEGVARIVVTTEEPGRYRRAKLASNAQVRHRRDIRDVESELAATPGVTVLIHDQMCAAESRRLRRRGKLPEPPERVWINERVCEGCGDCGEASGCLSVEPVETEFGRKTRIHQASCNKDMTCLKGDCPSFLTVRAPKRAAPKIVEPPADLPHPVRSSERDVTVRMAGIGGTGVVTVSQVLSMAAHLEGLSAAGLDQTGLSQKAGPVVSDVRLASVAARDDAPRATAASVDVLLAFDLLNAAEARVLNVADPQRTVAVVSDSVVPTGAMVTDGAVRYPDRGRLLARVQRRVAAIPVVVDAQRLAEVALGDALPANMILLGAAWQLGLIPVGWDALVRAVELNGVAVQTNLHALGWGRATVETPEAVAELLAGEEGATWAPDPSVVRRVAAAELPEEVRDLVLLRADDLHAYGGPRLVARYLDELGTIAARESEHAPGRHELTASVARQLHRLLAYKDEYEVARLHLLPEERARREREFGKRAAFWLHLHPPLLRALGLKRKLRLGRWSLPLLYVLRAMRRLRGTPLDLFGYAHVRRVERDLPQEYLSAVDLAVQHLAVATHERVVALSEEAETIRGYEDIKLRNVAAWREATAARLAELPAAGRSRSTT